mmetsp:Transcript_27953/g.74771  ORF Transcript_27953/g.74771 Transcript_27953/m.74771 type:complete len:281 (-) Transcript_27953:178-1020(-)
MIHALLGSIPVLRIHLEETPDEAFGVFRHVLPIGCVEGEVPKPDLGQHLRIRVAEEGRVAAEQHKHYDPAAPQIAHVVVLAREHLRRHVVGRASLRRQDLAWLEFAGEAEVNDLEEVPGYRLPCHKEEVLWLQVAVADVVLVHVVDSADDLLHQIRGLALVEASDFNDAIEQFSALAQLHDEVYVAVVLERFVQLDDVWVVHHLHDSNLLVKPVEVLHLGLGDRLDGTLQSPHPLVFALADRTVRSLADLLLFQIVVVKDLAFVVYDELCFRHAASGDLL